MIRTLAFARQEIAPIGTTGAYALAAGIFTETQHNAAAAVAARFFIGAAREAHPGQSQPFRGVHAMFGGTGADNTVHEFQLMGAWEMPGGLREETQWLHLPIAYGTYRLSTLLGFGASTCFRAGERVADEITIVKTSEATPIIGPGRALGAVLDATDPDAFSPKTDIPGVLYVGELGSPQRIFFDLKPSSGTAVVVAAMHT